MGQQVVACGLCKCSFGLAPSPLMVLPQNRILSSTGPAATIMDHKPFVNIMPFGMCTSPSNPAVIAALGAPVPCTPVTPAPWAPIAPNILTSAGGPVLTSTSMTMCAFAGVITVTFAGQVSQITTP